MSENITEIFKQVVMEAKEKKADENIKSHGYRKTIGLETPAFGEYEKDGEYFTREEVLERIKEETK